MYAFISSHLISNDKQDITRANPFVFCWHSDNKTYLFSDFIENNQLTNNKKNLDDKYNYYEWYKINELDNVNLLPEAYKKLVVNGEVTSIIVDNVKGE